MSGPISQKWSRIIKWTIKRRLRRSEMQLSFLMIKTRSKVEQNPQCLSSEKFLKALRREKRQISNLMIDEKGNLHKSKRPKSQTSICIKSIFTTSLRSRLLNIVPKHNKDLSCKSTMERSYMFRLKKVKILQPPRIKDTLSLTKSKTLTNEVLLNIPKRRT